MKNEESDKLITVIDMARNKEEKKFRKSIKKVRSSMSANVVGGIIGLMLTFGFLVCLIGNLCITNAFKNEYASVTYHMADTAATLVNGNHIDAYLAGQETVEYKENKTKLQKICYSLNVSLIYVIKVDTTDYGRFTNIVNIVNNEVDNSSYTPWELGFQRNTTNEEYRLKYQSLYETTTTHETVFRTHTTDGQHPHITTLVAIKNQAGETTAILCMQRPMREMENAMLPYMLSIIIGVIVMGAIITLIASYFIKRAIIEPVEELSNEASRFAQEKTIKERNENISHFDNILKLSNSLHSLEEDMVNYIDNLTSVTAEKERIGTELSIASKIQQDTLPDTFPAFPDRDDFDIYAAMDPAKEVGGDFYNFFLIDDDHLAMVIADVSGKGIPAALFMMVTNILISERTLHGGKPSKILENLNDSICAHNSSDMFVTIWLGILQLSTGKLLSANAGHEYPAIYRKGEKFEINKEKHGFVLGGMPGVKYFDQETTLHKGDKLFLYTDGVTEAMDKDDHMFTVDRLVKSLNKYKDNNPKDILDKVRSDINEFVGEADQFDDLTMLCLELNK